MASSSLSHGTGARHRADGSSTVPDWCLRQTAITGAVAGAIHRVMHISVARCGELCVGRAYSGDLEGVRRTNMQHGPAVRRRKLGAELRALRAGTGLTSGEAARLLGWHQSKVSRIETGTSGVKPADVERLLHAYGVEDPELLELLVVL